MKDKEENVNEKVNRVMNTLFWVSMVVAGILALLGGWIGIIIFFSVWWICFWSPSED